MGSQPAPNTYSASQISTLIGLNPFQTSLAGFQTMKEAQEAGWNSKHGYTLPDRPDNAAIRWGLGFESAIIKLAEEREGCKIDCREKLYTIEINGIIYSCHLDGEFVKPHSHHIHEGKTCNHHAYISTKQEIRDAIDLNSGKIMPGFKIVRKWGKPGTAEVPQEYQIQAAVQRVCTGAELVKLSVLVFPKAQQDYEDLGWKIKKFDSLPGNDLTEKYRIVDENDFCIMPMDWAKPWAQQGNFHTYELPTALELEKAIIESITKFHHNNFLPGIPPDPTTFEDVRRLMPNPLGSVIATKELVTLCKEYSENVRQLGTASPIRARQEILKPRIMDLANALHRADPTEPPDSFIILDPDGGDKLASVTKDKNGVISFRAKVAK